MAELKDQVIPQGAWAFDGEVAAVFDNMLQRSIPQYDAMRDACFDIAKRFRVPNSWIIDLGCSRGGALAQLMDVYGVHNKYYGCDVSEPMLDAARERFDGYIDAGIVEIENLDLRTDYPSHGASVVQSVLTLQFTPIEYRQRILKNVYDSLRPGGVFILVEKVLGSTTEINDIMISSYYDYKSEQGYTQEEIERKRLSLEGVLVPISSYHNEDLLRSTGFLEVDCFWRWMNFAGWLAIKE